MSKSDVIAAFEAFMTELRTHMEGILSAVPEDAPIAQAHDEEAAEIVSAIETAPPETPAEPEPEAPAEETAEPEPESQSDTPAEPEAPEAPPMLTHQVVA